jgi:hypothetical protein
MIKNNPKIPHCQKVQLEYKANLNLLREFCAAIKDGQPPAYEVFISCMEFIYREGWGDCFLWDGQIPGEMTREEFFKIIPIKRYGRNKN